MGILDRFGRVFRAAEERASPNPEGGANTCRRVAPKDDLPNRTARSEDHGHRNGCPVYTLPAQATCSRQSIRISRRSFLSLQEEPPNERVLTPTLDVIVVTPRLENAPRSWTFRQEGIPGTFNAIMKDKRFLAALDRQAVKEQFRSNISMRVRLEVKERNVDGEWKVVRAGRSVVEVISPRSVRRSAGNPECNNAAQ